MYQEEEVTFPHSQDLFADDEALLMSNPNEIMADNNDILFNIPSDITLTEAIPVNPSNIRVLPLLQTSESLDVFGRRDNVDSDFLDMSPSFMQQFSDSDPSIRQVYNNEDLLNANQLVSTATGNNRVPALIFQQEYLNAAAYISYSRENEVASPDCMMIPGTEILAFDNWGGPYDFKVTPVVDGKKGLYWEEKNKLYCKNKTAVPFNFEMDFSKIEDLDNMMIRVFLVFKDSDCASQPVVRCAQHIEEEKKITDESQRDRVFHFLKPRDPDANYFIHQSSKRCYLLVPLKFPEPGMAFVTRNFCFSCLNSCTTFGMDGKSRRDMAMMFYLYDKKSGGVVARRHIDIRICSAPARDFKKETGVSKDKNRKRRYKEDDAEASLLPSPKRVDVGMGEVPLSQLAESRAALPKSDLTVRSVVRAVKVEDDGVSSSQETVYSCDESAERISLRELVKDIRWVLKKRDCEDPRLRNYSKDVYSALRLTQSLCSSAREWESKQRSEDTSPDGGVHDVA